MKAITRLLGGMFLLFLFAAASGAEEVDPSNGCSGVFRKETGRWSTPIDVYQALSALDATPHLQAQLFEVVGPGREPGTFVLFLSEADLMEYSEVVDGPRQSRKIYNRFLQDDPLASADSSIDVHKRLFHVSDQVFMFHEGGSLEKSFLFSPFHVLKYFPFLFMTAFTLMTESKEVWVISSALVLYVHWYFYDKIEKALRLHQAHLRTQGGNAPAKQLKLDTNHILKRLNGPSLNLVVLPTRHFDAVVNVFRASSEWSARSVQDLRP